jgi:hypothetical protein
MGRNLTLAVRLASVLAVSLGLACVIHTHRHRVDGTILGLSTDARTMEVAGRDGNKLSVALSDKTDYRRDDSHQASLADMKAGSEVIVIYDAKNGINKAVEVHVFSTKK